MWCYYIRLQEVTAPDHDTVQHITPINTFLNSKVNLRGDENETPIKQQTTEPGIYLIDVKVVSSL